MKPPTPTLKPSHPGLRYSPNLNTENGKPVESRTSGYAERDCLSIDEKNRAWWYQFNFEHMLKCICDEGFCDVERCDGVTRYTGLASQRLTTRGKLL